MPVARGGAPAARCGLAQGFLWRPGAFVPPMWAVRQGARRPSHDALNRVSCAAGRSWFLRVRGNQSLARDLRRGWPPRPAPAPVGLGLSAVPDVPIYRAPSRPERRRHLHRLTGRGHRPCHSVPPGSGPAGGQSPRPAPDPPTTGASPPPGRALASVLPGPAGLQDTVPHGRGETRVAFPVPARRGEGTFTASMAGAIAPATAPR